MKRNNNINYDLILDIDKIIKTYHNIILSTKHRDKIFDYDMFYSCNLINIYNSLKDRTYSHGMYNIFYILKPKPRIIMSEKLNDKIVNHLVSDYLLLPLLNPCLIDTNVATRRDKGTKGVIMYMKKYLLKMHAKYDKFYILKCDISKYFYNIDHNILFNKLSKYIYDKDILNIIKNIVNSTNYSYVNKKIYNINKKLNMSLPLYKYNKGLPIGNQTSQLLAIFYLNDLDHFIKEKLHIKYYIRYMDDFILIHNSKEHLKYCLNEINNVLEKDKLKLNDKTNIYNIKNGITFIGFKYIFKNNKLILLIPSKTKRRIIKRINNKETNINNYNGYLCFGNTSNFYYKYEKLYF